MKYLRIQYTDCADCIKFNGKDCNLVDNIFPLGKATGFTDYDFCVDFTVEIATGRVLDWVKGNTARIYSKPVDSGVYAFLDGNKTIIKEIEGYVIDGLDIDSSGYGDYIILRILEDGSIEHWDSDLIMKNIKKESK